MLYFYMDIYFFGAKIFFVKNVRIIYAKFGGVKKKP